MKEVDRDSCGSMRESEPESDKENIQSPVVLKMFDFVGNINGETYLLGDGYRERI